MTAPTIEVVHLVYAPFGREPSDRFLASYRRHPAGRPHRLVLACKGFPAQPDTLPADVEHRAVIVPDRGFDIGTYLWWARRSTADLLCLFNSRSVILADGWLDKLASALEAQGGGAVGATASWQSFAADPRRADYPLAGARWTHPLRRWRHAWRAGRDFAGFPNPHLRTNAVLIARDLLLSLDAPEPRNKADALRFESGRKSLTRQLQALGLPVSVVDRDGRAYSPGDWDRARVFFAGEQEGLLVADNQTERYMAASPDERASLCRYAWRAPRG